MNVAPLRDRIIIKRIEAQAVSAGGIIIPDDAKEKPQQGEVVAVGSGRITDDGTIVPLEIKRGDRILFSKYSGTEIKIDGGEYLILREDDVQCILNRSAPEGNGVDLSKFIGK